MLFFYLLELELEKLLLLLDDEPELGARGIRGRHRTIRIIISHEITWRDVSAID